VTDPLAVAILIYASTMALLVLAIILRVDRLARIREHRVQRQESTVEVRFDECPLCHGAVRWGSHEDGFTIALDAEPVMRGAYVYIGLTEIVRDSYGRHKGARYARHRCWKDIT
jgi:hypothetical protein